MTLWYRIAGVGEPVGITVREGSKVSEQTAPEGEQKFEVRRCHLYTEDGAPIHGEYADSWYSDLEEVKLYVHIDKWPRGGTEWNALQRFLLEVDNRFRNFLDTREEVRRREAQSDDIPF